MELTPQMVREAEFREKLRGYDQEEVDAFLELVSNTIASLRGQLTEAVSRAESAESRAGGSSQPSETEEMLRRTLVLAQRTADAAIAEANETAAATVGEARHAAQVTVDEANAEARAMTRDAKQRADQMIAEAEAESRTMRTEAEEECRTLRTEAEAESRTMRTQAEEECRTLRTEAEAEARRVVEATRRPLIDEIRELEQIRAFLVEDIEVAENHLNVERDRLRASVAELRRLVEQPEAFRSAPLPELSGAALGEVEDLQVESEPPSVDEPTRLLEALAAAAEVDEVDEADERDDSGESSEGDQGAAEADLDPESSGDIWSPPYPADASAEPAPAGLDDAITEPPAGPPPLRSLTGMAADEAILDPDPDDSPRSSLFTAARPIVLPAADEDEAEADPPAGERRFGASVDDVDGSATGDDPEGGFDYDGIVSSAVAGVGQPAEGGDAFLDELRRAVSEDDADDDDPALAAFFDDDEGSGLRSRFRRR